MRIAIISDTHGNLTALEAVLAELQRETVDRMIVATTADSTLAEYYTDLQATVLAGGHTHAPFMRRWQDKIVLNPGSVGLPYEALADGTVRNPPWAEYAILAWQAGRANIELRRAPVDRAAVRKAVKQSAMPFGAWWLNNE